MVIKKTKGASRRCKVRSGSIIPPPFLPVPFFFFPRIKEIFHITKKKRKTVSKKYFVLHQLRRKKKSYSNRKTLGLLACPTELRWPSLLTYGFFPFALCSPVLWPKWWCIFGWVTSLYPSRWPTSHHLYSWMSLYHKVRIEQYLVV